MSDSSGHSVVIVGASGLLWPAAAQLVMAGVAVVGVARSGDRPMPDGVTPVLVDARDSDALTHAVAGAAADAEDALVYEPASSPDAIAALSELVRGRVVTVRTSWAADPALGEFAVAADTLVLGWTADDAGGIRWHTRAEVSEAALAVLEDGAGRVLGAIRPWSDRPR